MTLGLRMKRPRAAWITSALVFATYLLTMARDLTFYDSPELALVAHQLGVGHPIGQPLHTLLGFVFAHIPGLSVHVGLTMMSALFGALCVLPAWSLSERLGGHEHPHLPALALLGIGASLVAWEPSSRVEVYTLAAFLALWATAFAAERPGFAAGLAIGLAASSHAVIAFASGLSLLPRALARGRSADPGPVAVPVPDAPLRRRTLLFAGGALLGLLPYAYVPLAASDPERFAWGAPRDGASIGAYLSGADYAQNQGITAELFVDHLGQLISWGFIQSVLPVALVGALAFFVLGRKHRLIGYAVLITALVDIGFVAANVIFHPDVPDYRGYFLVPLWLAGAGIAALANTIAKKGGRNLIYGGLVAALPAVAVLLASGHLHQARDTPSLARLIAEGALDEAPRDAILIVEADHWIAPLLYLQEVEQRRADVTVVAVGLSSSRWYWEHTLARHPDLNEFALVGPGGRRARLRRFLDANRRRPVLAESFALATGVGRFPCDVGYLVWTLDDPDAACGEADATAASRAIERLPALRGESREVAARVGEARGTLLWQLGRGRDAFAALLAGLDGPEVISPADVPLAAPPLGTQVPDWSRPAALHDPLGNYVVAGLLLHSLGFSEEALELVDFAREDGHPGASVARDQIVGH